MTLKFELHPDINVAFVRQGFGTLLEATAAHGDLAWQRAELRLIARRAFGPMIYAARADAGLVAGDSASSDAARLAILRLGTVNTSVTGRPGDALGASVSRPTGGFKSSIDFRLRFFGGAVSAGVARATDRHQPWRFVFGLAQVI